MTDPTMAPTPQDPQQPSSSPYTQNSDAAYQPNAAQYSQTARPEYGQPEQPAQSTQPQYGQAQPTFDQAPTAPQEAYPTYGATPAVPPVTPAAPTQQPTYTTSTGQPYTGASPYGEQSYGSVPAPAPGFSQQPSPTEPAQPYMGQPSTNAYAGAPNSNQAYGAPQYSQYAQPGMPGIPAATTNGEPPLNMPWYGIDFGNAIKRFFTKYATFSGRASRSEFWWVVLFLTIVSIVFSLLSQASNVFLVLENLWNLAVLIPTLAVGVRRLHDSNLPGPWLLLPYGLLLLGFICMAASGAGFLLSAVAGSSTGVGGSVAGFIIGILLFIGALAAEIVLMVRQSNPSGARFDRP